MSTFSNETGEATFSPKGMYEAELDCSNMQILAVGEGDTPAAAWGMAFPQTSLAKNDSRPPSNSLGKAKRAMTPLIVVDMQNCYEETVTDVLPAVLEEIEKAKFEGQPIILLRIFESRSWLNNCGLNDEIIEEVFQAVAGYPETGVWTKTSQCGGEKVKFALHDRWEITPDNNPPEKLRIVGVNTGACVKATAEWLAEDGFAVEIVAHAVNDSYESTHEKTLAAWKEGRQKNLQVA